MSKAKQYTVILIDPETRTIRKLESPAGLDDIHKLVGAETLDSFGVALFEDNGHRDFGWVDDGGLTRGEPVRAFVFSSTKNPIAGKCLIVGATREGVTASCRISIDILRTGVEWLGTIKPDVTWDAGSDGIIRPIVTYSRLKES